MTSELPPPMTAVAVHELDDGRLVQRHLEGDPRAFGALVDRYQRATSSTS
ncbi:MAG TPA: hypothetical protein VF978_00320 [Gemmatimonadales bacterium]